MAAYWVALLGAPKVARTAATKAAKSVDDWAEESVAQTVEHLDERWAEWWVAERVVCWAGLMAARLVANSAAMTAAQKVARMAAYLVGR